MSTQMKSRPVLRPAGNVANTRKPTKKPPASPPLKPSSALCVKISPPNSLPTTPRASLSKSPALAKPVSSPKLAPTKLSTPPANVKSDVFIDPAHVRHRHASLHPPTSQTRASASGDMLNPTLIQDQSSLHSPPFSDDSSVIDRAPRPCNDHVLDACEHVAPATISALDAGKETTSTLAASSDALNLTTDAGMSNCGNSVQLRSCHAPCGVSHFKTVESPASQRKVIRRSSLSRSSSDHFQRGPARYAKANGSSLSSIRIVSHSLDDTSLAQLAAAKKAASCELSAQRKLKVSEYGRKPGKAARVAPDIPSVAPLIAEPQRCKFITAQSDPLYMAYHDEEWGVPVHDDRSLFELLVLAGAQVELSWTTILHKREAYRNVFCGYDPAVVALFKERHIQSLEADKTLLLQGGKIRGVVENAQRVLEVVKEFGSLDTYLWSFLNYKPMINSYRYPKQLPAKTSKSEFISKDLVRRGFRFVGPTIVYSFMQAAGMTNDHLVQCFRHKACTTTQMNLSHEDAKEGKSEDYVRVEGEMKCDISMLHTDAAQVDSKPLLQEVELQTHYLGQQFTQSEFVHIEAY